jgi:hypothetical protein
MQRIKIIGTFESLLPIARCLPVSVSTDSMPWNLVTKGRRIRAGAEAGNIDCHGHHYVREYVRSLGGIGVKHVIVTVTVTLMIDDLCTFMSLTT